MTKRNQSFFMKKKDWSKVKDTLLGVYLEPYFQKILTTDIPTLYVDCFAGKGRYEDGSDGSPRIALTARNRALARTTVSNPKIECVFIDLLEANGIEENIKDLFLDGFITKTINGKSEEELPKILKNKAQQNLFVYLDPFGPSAINFETLTSGLKGNFYSVEILLNFNIIGFLRVALATMDIEYYYDVSDCDIDEFLSDPVIVNKETALALTDFIGGNYWQDIVIDYKERNLSFSDAEQLLSNAYKKELKKHYKYVLDMPIKTKNKNIPKYRLIHATNHEDGCNLMAKNMINRSNDLIINVQNRGQLTFLDSNVYGRRIDQFEVVEKIENLLKIQSNPVNLSVFTARFYSEYGVICRFNEIFNAMRSLEKKGKIFVARNPELKRNGQPTKFWSESKSQKVIIKYLPNES